MRQHFFLLLAVLILLVASQSQDITPLPLTGQLAISLASSSPTSYKIVVPSDASLTDDLYLRVEPTVADPFQVPYLTVRADNNYLQNCYNAHEQFAGICKIDSIQLKPGRQFDISIRCVTSCKLNLQTYLSKIITLPLGKQLALKSSAQQSLTVLVLVQIPSSADYTALSVLAVITNIQQNAKSPEQKLDMLINYGDQNVQAPTDDHFALEGLPLFTGGRGAHLAKQNVPPGSWIKVYLRLQTGVSITFSVSQIAGSSSQISLGLSYFDYTEQQLSKTYSLNVSEHQTELVNKTIELVFDIYSGNPQITIAFDAAFTREVPFTRKTSALSYSLSPSLRGDLGFVDSVYIKVSSSISSEYYFYTKVIRDDAAFIQPYLAYFDEVEEHQVENYLLIERFSYPSTNTNYIANYSFKVEVVAGRGSFYFKRCQSIQMAQANDNNLQGCLIDNLEQLSSSNFLSEEIQNKNVINANMMSIEMSYDVSNCNQLDNKAGIIYKQCAFQIIAVGQSPQPFVFSLTAEKKAYNTYLKENRIVKNYLSKSSYVFYSFSLPTLANVTEINIFLTTFSGESALIVSTFQQFPTLQTASGNVIMQSGQKSSIVLQKDQIAQQIYISVYAYQFTQINLGVVVHRSSDTDLQNLNEIVLELGHLLTYTLTSIQQTVSFKINSNNADSIIVSLTQLVGHCSFQVLNIANMAMPCQGKKDNLLKCQINTSRNTMYRIIVKGKDAKTNKFIITYNNGRSCTNAALNLPTYVALHSNQNECYVFPINRDIVVKFDSSFTHSQILDRQIKVDIYVNDLYLKTIEGSHYDITPADMSSACPFGIKNPGLVKTCQISIDFISNSDRTTFFNFVLEEEDAEVALFDGIVESISDLDVSFGGGKSFYYHLYSSSSIKILFTTKSNELTYFLVAKLLSKQAFLKLNQQQRSNMYQQYLSIRDTNQQSGNLYSVTMNSAETAVISIDRQFIINFCESILDCYLIITVAPTNLAVPVVPGAPAPPLDDSTIQTIYYEIQVTQEETYLALGESKVGFVEQGQVYVYLIDPQEAIINIRDLNKEGQKSSKCASISYGTNNDDDGVLSDVTQLGGNFQTSKQDNIDKIYVRGDAGQCSYQISYISISQPIKTARLSTPYQLQLLGGQNQGFLFYNMHPSSFRIMQMVSAGEAEIYILPFSESNLTLASALSLDFKSFPLVDKIDGDFVVSSTSQSFCYNCFYYVVVTASSKFIGEIVFLRLSDAIPLSLNHMLKQVLSPKTQLTGESYVFYSLTAFSVSFNILSGTIHVTLTDPKGNNLFEQILTESKVFPIKAIQYDSKQKIEFLSKKALYQIKVETVLQSEFYLRLDKHHATERIFEGYPTTINFLQKTPTTVEFVNSQQLDHPLSVMADVMEEQGIQAIVTFSLSAELQTGEVINQKQLYISSADSQNTYILKLKNIKGAYYITVEVNIPVNITFLLFKDQLTHIVPTANHFFDAQGIFQLYSNNKNVLVEIFACKGDISVTAAKDYQNITHPEQGSLLSLKRPNYGGHYVFGVENVEGSYFLKVSNKQTSNQLQYLINYHSYDQIEPYESIDAVNYDVTYEFNESGLVVSVNPPVLSSASAGIQIKSIKYWAYASAGRQSLNRYSQCSIDSNTVESWGAESPLIIIQNSQVNSLFDDSASPERLFVSVQASIEVSVAGSSDPKNNYPKTLTILYNVAEIQTAGWTYTAAANTYWFTDSLVVFIGWMLLPFALAGVIVFFLLKHCLRCVIPDNSGFIEESDSEKTNQNVNRIAQTTVELRDMKSTTFDLRDMKSTTFELVHRKTNLKDVDSASAENNIKENEEI